MLTLKFILDKFCFIFICTSRFCCLMVQVYKQIYICRKKSPNRNIEYINFQTVYQIQISNEQICSLQPDLIQILNICVLSNLAEYKCIKYIRNQKIEYCQNPTLTQLNSTQDKTTLVRHSSHVFHHPSTTTTNFSITNNHQTNLIKIT